MTVSNASTYLFTPAVDVSESYTSNAANQHTEVRRGPVLRFPVGYDLAGNLVSDGANLFGYDSQNRLVSADMAAGSVSAGIPGTVSCFPIRFSNTIRTRSARSRR